MAGKAACLIVTATVFICAAYPEEFACDQCHPEQSRTQPLTAMAHAAERVASAEILKRHPSLRVSLVGYTYAITRNGANVTYSVSGKSGTLTADLIWAFGFGSMGQTYLYEYRGALYESHVSFYSAVNGLDITIGHHNAFPANLELAAGRRIEKFEAARCFGCHTTDNSPGVDCQHCHTGALEHARSFASGSRSSIPTRLSRLNSDELSDLCGECHRTWQDVTENGPHDINNIRFQPYRLATSRCYNSSAQDRRISCVACHDPHQNVVKSAAWYDAKCVDCHRSGSTAAARICSVGQSGCISCHMPKVDFPGGHFKFTDHRIRIVRDNSYPN